MVWEIQVQGPGKSWNLLGNDVDAMMQMQMQKYARPHTSVPYSTSVKSARTVSLLFLNNMNIYFTMDAAVILYG